MKFEEINELWAVDAIIDRTDLAGAAVEQAKLHHKYWMILNDEKRRFFYLRNEKITLTDFLERYYGDRSNLTDEELAKYGREVPDGLEIKAQAPLAAKINKDSLMVDLTLKLAIQEQKCEYLLDIIKCINGRSFQISAAAKVLEYSRGAT